MSSTSHGEGESGWPPQFHYCPFCGHPLQRLSVAGSLRPMCVRCRYVQYLNPVSVVAAVLLSDRSAPPPADTEIPPAEASHLLLVRRAETYRGSWCIPCGYVDYHEEIRVAAQREMEEETGLRTAAASVFAVHSNFHNPQRHTVGTWFLVRYLSGELRAGDDADRVGFFPLTGLPAPLAFPTDQKVIARLQQLARGEETA